MFGEWGRALVPGDSKSTKGSGEGGTTAALDREADKRQLGEGPLQMAARETAVSLT